VRLDLVLPSATAAAPAAPAAAAPTATPAATAPSAEDRSTTFRPVEGGTEMQSGEKLLVEAYAAIWIILFAFVLLSWRRQRKIDERVTSLEAAVEAARAAAPQGGAAPKGDG
jgi:CcmD family protein